MGDNSKLLVGVLEVDCHQIKLGLITKPTGTRHSATDSV